MCGYMTAQTLKSSATTEIVAVADHNKKIKPALARGRFFVLPSIAIGA